MKTFRIVTKISVSFAFFNFQIIETHGHYSISKKSEREVTSGGEIIKDGGEVYRGTGANTIGVIAGLEKSCNSSDGELEIDLLRSGGRFGNLGFAFASFGRSRRAHRDLEIENPRMGAWKRCKGLIYGKRSTYSLAVCSESSDWMVRHGTDYQLVSLSPARLMK